MNEQVQAYLDQILKHPNATEILAALASILAAVSQAKDAKTPEEQRMAQAAALNARGHLEEKTGVADIRRERIIIAATGGQTYLQKIDQNLISRLFSPNVIKTDAGQVDLRFALSQFFYDEKSLIDRKPLDEIHGRRDTTPSISGTLAAHFLNVGNGYSGTFSRPNIIEDGSPLSPVTGQGKSDESGPAHFLRIKTVELVGYTCGFQKLKRKHQAILKLAALYFNEKAKLLRKEGWKIRLINWETVRVWTSDTSEPNHASLKAIFENARKEGLADAEANHPDPSRLLGQTTKL
jgi:hypothetical protein